MQERKIPRHTSGLSPYMFPVRSLYLVILLNCTVVLRTSLLEHGLCTTGTTTYREVGRVRDCTFHLPGLRTWFPLSLRHGGPPSSEGFDQGGGSPVQTIREPNHLIIPFREPVALLQVPGGGGRSHGTPALWN